MQFIRTVGLAALVIATPAVQAAIVTLGFDLTPTMISASAGAHGTTTSLPTPALPDATSFSLTVQFDTAMLFEAGILTVFPSPTTSFHYALSSTFSDQVLLDLPAYADTFNDALPYAGGPGAGAIVDLERLIDGDESSTLPGARLTIDTVLSNTVEHPAQDQIQNLRLLSLRMGAPSLSDPQATTGPYLGDDAVAWLQTLQGLTMTNGFRDTLSLVQRRLIPGADGTSWVVDRSSEGILSEQRIGVTGDIRLRTVTVAVPEPSTSIMAAFGVIGLLAARRRSSVS